MLAISVTVSGALGMGAALTFVLVGSNVVISLLRKIIPDKVRIPCFIVVIATFVTLVEMIVEAYLPGLYRSLGISSRSSSSTASCSAAREMFASRHGVVDSLLDGLGMGVGYTVVIVGIAVVRELVGQRHDLRAAHYPGGLSDRHRRPDARRFFCFAAAMALLRSAA